MKRLFSPRLAHWLPALLIWVAAPMPLWIMLAMVWFYE